MSASGFGDAEKLALAQELAQSFKKGSKVVHGGAPKSVQQPRHRAAQGPHAFNRGPTANGYAVDSGLKHGPPPPSQRRYHEHATAPSGPHTTQKGRLNATVEGFCQIGTMHGEVDTNDIKPSQVAQNHCTTMDPSATYWFQNVKPNGIAKGSILDRFYNIVNPDKEVNIQVQDQSETRSTLNVEARPFVPLKPAKKGDRPSKKTNEQGLSESIWAS
ncbi:hypothetical protein CDD82_1936 [Ophiocordyceps australis]|uniref:Uncharacterized protein n=1 Tax=Ophiocordyceps australis TaxID=1399860 RepID=A0A2C5ZJK0_9HYPO|nr:hypothetical protein CDD82_1936 [Ophiocordyceps australis]